MMSGVRIRHQTRRSERFNFEDPSRPYPEPCHCPPSGCGRIHLFKAVHIDLDDTGAAIVAVAIWQRYAHLFRQHGFAIVNEVPEPPEQRIFISGPLRVHLHPAALGVRHAD